MPDFKSTGPRTPEGKAKSNALTYGLFARQDYVRLGEEDDYQQLRDNLWQEINPEGVLEEIQAQAILSATWRLRRCGLVEANLAQENAMDPMEDVVADKIQTSVDRARSQAHNTIRRSLAELRRLQTSKAIERELSAGEDTAPEPNLVDHKAVVHACAENAARQLRMKKLERPLAGSSFCKTDAAPPAGPNQPAPVAILRRPERLAVDPVGEDEAA